MVVQHNLTAMNSNRMLGVTTSAQAKSTEKLSSGYKINRAADDAAGLSISEKMRKQIRGLTQASSNAQDGISAVQTAEGALNEVQDMLQRMNELAVQSANGTNSSSDRQAIQDEIDQLTTEIDRVSETTKFNETYLLKGDGTATAATVRATGDIANYVDLSAVTAENKLTFYNDEAKNGMTYTATVSNDGADIAWADKDGTTVSDITSVLEDMDVDADSIKALGDGTYSFTLSASATNSDLDFNLHVGADSTSENKIGVNIEHMSAGSLGVYDLKVTTEDTATASIDTIAKALQTVSDQRSALGAIQNRLEHTIKNLDNVVENTTSAESQIRDTDMATEMVRYSNNNILAQAGQSMLAQANQSNQGVLSLLG